MQNVSVVLIILDTLRRDYGEKHLTPILRDWGFRYYPNAVSTSPWTTPSHASIFTGLYPIAHGTHETRSRKLDSVRLEYGGLLSTRLQSMGYSTHLMTANVFVSPYFGFGGFDSVFLLSKSPPDLLSFTESKRFKAYSRGSVLQTAYSLLKNGEYLLLLKSAFQKVFLNNRFIVGLYSFFSKWPLDMGISEVISRLSRIDTREPVFLAMNLMEMHEPYPTLRNSREINFHTVKSWAGKLSGEIATGYQRGYQMEANYLSRKLPHLLGALKKMRLFDNSLVIILSDHGQLLGEHGKINHGTFLYDELIRVPLWIKYPWEVEPAECMEGYISLVKIRELITEVAEGGYYSDEKLCSPVAFSEVYGTHIDYSTMNLSNEELERIKGLEKYRIAVYYKNFKGIFNVPDWRFEKVISYDPSMEVNEDILKRMKKEIVKFLKTATVAKVPKLSL